MNWALLPKGKGIMKYEERYKRWENYVSSNIQIAGMPEGKQGEYWRITDRKINSNAQYGENIQQNCVIIIKLDKTRI